MPLFSVLDLSPIVQGGSAARALQCTLDLAQHAERWGYHRYWVAEHHNLPGIASAATAVVIAHVAAGTSRIRVGSGGIMLPNHSPLVIAEQFGTLESLFPGRIDLGLGRAPGGDQVTAAALRKKVGPGGADTFPADVRELLGYFRPSAPGQLVRAVPGAGLDVPLYMLGSSDFGARLAAELGLPFAFASHFAPAYLHEALAVYRGEFRPSPALARPHVIVGVNVFAAETDAEARRLFTSLQQQFLNLVRRLPRELPPPVDSMEDLWDPAEEIHARRMTRCSAVGAPETVRAALEAIHADTKADELIVTAQIYDHAARLRSFELAAEVLRKMT
jgi:luciferase family oxidoreductase group 1